MMPKKNKTLICNNFLTNNQEREQAFTQKMTELINQAEALKSVDISKQDNHTYNNIKTNWIVSIESPKQRGDKT